MVVTTNFASEIAARRRAQPFVPFALIMNDGTLYTAREALSFAIREKDMMLATASNGTVRIAFSEISRIEDRPLMTEDQAKLRDELIALLDGSPFAPFAIQMTDGSMFHIIRRWQAALGVTKGTVVSEDRKTSRNFHIRDIRFIKDSART